MNTLIKTSAAFLLLCAFVFAEGPKAVITDASGNPPPEEVPAGEALFLSASQAVAGEKPNSIVWIIKPSARAERSRTYGRDLCIPLGTKDCILVVTQIAALGDEASYAEITIHIKGESVTPPTPPVPPGPNPPPPPPVPVVGLTALVEQQLNPIAAANPSLTDTLTIGAVAVAYHQAAQEVTDGKITTIDGLLDRTKELVHSATKTRLSVLWKPVSDEVEKELQRLGDAGKLPDLKSHLPYWAEIEAGIYKALGA